MKPFDFRTVTNIHVEFGGGDRLGETISTWFPKTKVLAVTDLFLHQSGLIDGFKSSLMENGYPVMVFDGVEADPPEKIVQSCLDLAIAEQVGIVIGIGGGSSMDVAKVVAALAKSGQQISTAYGIGNLSGDRLPLIQIPTTAGTGSEVTSISILTTGANTKMGIVADQLYADRVLLDAKLTLGLPQLHTAATGIDAMVHAIEAYTSLHLKNPISDMLAREALRLLSTNLLAVCADGNNVEAREAMLLGAMFAGQSFANSPVAGVHALAYPLGGQFNIPHGLSNALMLGPVLEFNAVKAAHLYAELGDVFCIARTGRTDDDAGRFISHLLNLIAESGAPRRLRDVGIPVDAIPALTRDALQQTRLLKNNPVLLDEAAIQGIYERAY